MTPAESTMNPGQLKLELGLLGVELDDVVRSRTRVRDDGPPEERHGVELILPEDLLVSAPLREAPRHSPFLLRSRDERTVLECERGAVDVRLIEPPAFYDARTLAGTTMRQVATVHGSFVALQPDIVCGFAAGPGPCWFCSGDESATSAAEPHSVADVVEVVRAAFAEGVAEGVFFHLPASEEEDGGIAAIERHIRAIKSNFDTAVAVQMHPPKSNRWIDETYAMGVDAISYALEVYDEEQMRRHCPGRAQRLGRRRYFEALAHAASIFPSGTVWSELVIGLESPASTRRGIEALVSMGVLPVLAMRRHGGADWPMAQEDMAPLFRHLFRAVRDTKINMGWIRDLSFAISPLEARFFAGDDARMGLALHQFYRSRLGQSAARSLARLRRRLRVRRVSDSFDSSHL